MWRPPQSMKLPTWWWLLVFAKKEAKSGRSSGAVPKMRRQSFHSDAMPQIKHNSRWLGQDWGLLAIKIQFGQNVSTSADRLIPNQIRQCVGLQQKNKVLTADKIATLRTAKAKSFAIQSIAEELQNQPNLSNTKRQRQTTTCLCCQSNLFKQTIFWWITAR